MRLPESLCDVTSGLMVSLSALSPPPAPPLPKVRDSCRLILRILSMSGGREGGAGCDAGGGGAASLETAPAQVGVSASSEPWRSLSVYLGE